MDDVREKLKAIFAAGVAAVAPDAALMRHLELTGAHSSTLGADGVAYDLTRGKVTVVGAGKGAAPMASALEKLLGSRIDKGFVVVKDGHELPLGHIRIGAASHPVPNAAGEKAARQILQLARGLEPGDLLICLLTGGASALTPCPAPGLTLADLRQTTSQLLASGAHIGEVNAIRKHLSAFSGGRLAVAANGANVLALIVSDVIGDDLAAIASGPTAPDPTTFADCLAIVEKYGLAVKLPAQVMGVLNAGVAGKIPETPKPDANVFERVNNILVATNAQALEACSNAAANFGYEPLALEQPMSGEAALQARDLIARAEKLAASLKPGDRGLCLLAGGETTVRLSGSGLGGRNQEMALAAALALAGKKGIAALFAGTDGSDGPTDAAGGFALGDSLARLGGMDQARKWLADNDSNTALRHSGDLLVTGPTLTNVMDLAIILVDAPQA